MNVAVMSGTVSGTTTTVAAADVVFQSARQPASVTIGLGCTIVVAVKPTASMHDAVSAPTHPDAPATVNASRRRSVYTALELPLGPTVSDVAGDATVMPVGRDASAGLVVAQELTLMARLQTAASRDSTRSDGDGVNSPPGSAVSAGVDAHDTANVAG